MENKEKVLTPDEIIERLKRLEEVLENIEMKKRVFRSIKRELLESQPSK
jgi:hypothetical protein